MGNACTSTPSTTRLRNAGEGSLRPRDKYVGGDKTSAGQARGDSATQGCAGPKHVKAP